MAPHQQRVVSEREELAVKAEKLDEFFDSSIFRGLDLEERRRLVAQSYAMKLYLEILDSRIRAFSLTTK